MSIAAHPRVAAELVAIKDEFEADGPVETVQEGNELYVIVTCPTDGWAPENVRVLVKVPPLYPEQRPDLLFIQADAHPKKGGPIPNTMTAPVTLDRRQWAQVSWHFTADYDPSKENLLGFVRSARKYLRLTS